MLLLLLSHFSHVRLCATPSLAISMQGQWSGLPFPSRCIKVKSEIEVTQSCPTLHDPMECSLPGSSVHGIFQARVLEWGAIAFSGQWHTWVSRNRIETYAWGVEQVWKREMYLNSEESERPELMSEQNGADHMGSSQDRPPHPHLVLHLPLVCTKALVPAFPKSQKASSRISDWKYVNIY